MGERDMKKITHKAHTRGGAEHGWLSTKHTFSFADYFDPDRVNFGKLRVINDDTVQAAMGFPTHGHQNMEIVTIPLSGALEHKDSMGTTSVIQAGEVQIMSAGTGVTHSEFNHSKTELVSLLQIWVHPEKINLEPRYQQKKFDVSQRKNSFQTVVSPEKNEESVWINQQAYFSLCNLEAAQVITYTLHNPSHGAYIFLIEGKITIDGEELENRDGMGVWETSSIALKGISDSEILIIEVPMN
jgi:redox-sensitive bicupin YhaK (pirin superfamily)